MSNPQPGVNGCSTADTTHGRDWEARTARRVEELHIHSEPLQGKGALFVRVIVEGPAGETLYDDAIPADEGGLESGTRQIVRETGVEATLIEARLAGLITDAKRRASPGAAGRPAGTDDVLAGIQDLPTFLSQQE